MHMHYYIYIFHRYIWVSIKTIEIKKEANVSSSIIFKQTNHRFIEHK